LTLNIVTAMHKNRELEKPSGRKLSVPEAIMRDTIEWLLRVPSSEREMMEMAESHTFSQAEPAPAWGAGIDARTQRESSTMATLDLGSVEAAALLVEKGFRPALLNFAHDYNCGGGFEHAGGSQEEDIFRKTSLFLSLWPHRRSDDGPGVLKRGLWIGDYDEAVGRKEPFYPHTECGGIYSPHVRVVRDLKSHGPQLLDAESCESTPKFAVLTVAAQNASRNSPFKPKLLLKKVRTVLWMAASRGHDSVVLGAFGCGYFSNPPDAVADAFQKLLGPDGEFENVFSLVIFAVIRGNSSPFAKRFPALRAAALPSATRLPRRSLDDSRSVGPPEAAEDAEVLVNATGKGSDEGAPQAVEDDSEILITDCTRITD